MKKVFSMLAILLLCFSLPVNASASSVPYAIAQPYYEKSDTAMSKLDIKGVIADCESYILGDANVVKITATQYLQKQGFLWIWSTYDGAEWKKNGVHKFVGYVQHTRVAVK